MIRTPLELTVGDWAAIIWLGGAARYGWSYEQCREVAGHIVGGLAAQLAAVEATKKPAGR